MTQDRARKAAIRQRMARGSGCTYTEAARELVIDSMHAAAGVSYEHSHAGYIAAVAATAAAAGIPVRDHWASCEDARDGIVITYQSFDGDSPPAVHRHEHCYEFLAWEETRGWAIVFKNCDDGPLDGDVIYLDIPILAAPHEVVIAYLAEVPTGETVVQPPVWVLPGDYSRGPRYRDDCWDLSLTFEQSLLAYPAVSPGAP